MNTYYLPLFMLVCTPIGLLLYNWTSRTKVNPKKIASETFNAVWWTGFCVLYWHYGVLFQ